MAKKRKLTRSQHTDGRRRYSRSRYAGHGPNANVDETGQRVSTVTAEAIRATADRVTLNTKAAVDVMHEQAEQFVDEFCQQSDFMARQVENFFSRWVQLVTWPMQVTRQVAAADEEMREEQRAA